MRKELIGLSQRYVRTLRKQLEREPGANCAPASGLGRQAAALGLEPLGLARIHERALATLKVAGIHDGLIRRAEIFFKEALNPMVERHRAARESKMDLARLNATLNRRTLELAAANSQLQRGIVRCKNMEAALKTSREQYAKLLKESLLLEEGLRQLTRRLLAAQEEERTKISLELQNEIVKTLLGINVRLVTFKQEARSKTKGLKNDIAGAQRLVARSLQWVRRAARESGMRERQGLQLAG
jgi:signal transduction histidine kinase